MMFYSVGAKSLPHTHGLAACDRRHTVDAETDPQCPCTPHRTTSHHIPFPSHPLPSLRRPPRSPKRLPVDEDEAARDVARAMSKVRPLLQRYELRYEELAAQLSRAQTSAASATREARARSQAHLWTFDRLGEGCAVLRRDLAAGEGGGRRQGGGRRGRRARRVLRWHLYVTQPWCGRSPALFDAQAFFFIHPACWRQLKKR